MQEESKQNQETNITNISTFQSDDLLEKLKLLNYEKLLLELKIKPISRFYFIKSSNPGEQFYMFTLICWWLCKKLGKDMERPQEFDDPHTVCANIIKVLEEMDVPVNFQSTQLIKGAGWVCLHVLDCLATQALKVAKISCRHALITQEEENANEYIEDNAEIILEKLEEQNELLDEDSDMEMNERGDSKKLNWIGYITDTIKEKENQDKLTDQQQWRLELERAMGNLKIFVKADARDWRTHLNQMDTLKTNIIEISDETQAHLKKLHNEFTFSLEKVESREKHLNNELQTLIKQYKDIATELNSVQYAQTQTQTEIENLIKQLSEVITENDTKKGQMEQRGQIISDGNSVVQIKKAIAKLKEDVSNLNLEVAILMHTLDQNIMQHTFALREQPDAAVGMYTIKAI